MRKFLITGGAGFIPSSLADRLLQDEQNFVVALDNFSTGRKQNLPRDSLSNYQFFRCDVNDYGSLSNIMNHYHFDYVFHYAAIVGVRRTLENPLGVLGDIEGTKNVLSLCKETNVKRIFFASSSEVYGESKEYPQHEELTPLNSKLPYAIVKKVGESYLESFKKTYGLDYTIFRFFNTYGVKQSHDFVVSRFLNLASKNEPITIYGDGLQTRTFCYIDDNIEVTTKILCENLAVNDILNLGSEIEISILSLAEKIIAITGSTSSIIHLPALEKGDMARRKPDNAKMKRILGRELISLDEGLKRILTHYQLS
jgi:UDP-glucose 4-epimerase